MPTSPARGRGTAAGSPPRYRTPSPRLPWARPDRRTVVCGLSWFADGRVVARERAALAALRRDHGPFGWVAGQARLQLVQPRPQADDFLRRIQTQRLANAAQHGSGRLFHVIGRSN